MRKEDLRNVPMGVYLERREIEGREGGKGGGREGGERSTHLELMAAALSFDSTPWTMETLTAPFSMNEPPSSTQVAPWLTPPSRVHLSTWKVAPVPSSSW